jgi:hypothetical protein
MDLTFLRSISTNAYPTFEGNTQIHSKWAKTRAMMSPKIRSSTMCTTSPTFNYMSSKTLFLLPSTFKNSPKKVHYSMFQKLSPIEEPTSKNTFVLGSSLIQV